MSESKNEGEFLPGFEISMIEAKLLRRMPTRGTTPPEKPIYLLL